MTKTILLCILTALAAACDSPAAQPDSLSAACETRAYAVCDALIECDPTLRYDYCFDGHVGFCRTAVAPPTFERALECADDVELVNACETMPRACSLRDAE